MLLLSGRRQKEPQGGFPGRQTRHPRKYGRTGYSEGGLLQGGCPFPEGIPSEGVRAAAFEQLWLSSAWTGVFTAGPPRAIFG